jgi:hypothetical protein
MLDVGTHIDDEPCGGVAVFDRERVAAFEGG